ncbi:MAG: DUF1906 domain-containing protein [Nocardioides sp.]|uniref:glycoside hydrolase domain-containing protein n=1 Tax=Nocardioides sp. TaxID=35761 RepID=UPI0039E6FE91
MTKLSAIFPRRRTASGALGSLLVGVVAATLLLANSESPSTTDSVELASSNPVTPGNFTGFGFDQCQAPSQKAMNAWLRKSPFLGVGIYIAGKSRGCRHQTYLNATWVHTQLAKGWRLLPITLGPQASCQPNFPRYGDDPTIKPKPAHLYVKARRQGRAQAVNTIKAAKALGITAGSVMYYDLESFTYSNTRCRESAMWFVSAWTKKVRELGYQAGLYSSAASGIKAMDAKRANRPKGFVLPNQIWIADWDGKAGTTSTYVSNSGWTGHQRIKQYQGGHNETWGGVRINIDRDYLDVGKGSVAPAVSHCGGTTVSFTKYPAVKPPTKKAVPNPSYVKALKCLLKERGSFTSKNMTGLYGPGLRQAINAWQRAHGFEINPIFGRKNWMSLFATGSRPLLKRGSASERVRDMQRALNAVDKSFGVSVTGVYDYQTQVAVTRYQKSLGGAGIGYGNSATWKALAKGRFTS